MRILMGIIKNRHGVYTARRAVPKPLQAALARVMESSKERVAYLQETLDTKDLREANTRGKPVLMKFDRLIAKAGEASKAKPERTHVSNADIQRMAAYHYACTLEEDEEMRREGTGRTESQYGLSEREMVRLTENVEHVLPAAKAALARGDVPFVADILDDLLDVFRINLRRDSLAYRKLGWLC